jgi:hypothetical protein
LLLLLDLLVLPEAFGAHTTAPTVAA